MNIRKSLSFFAFAAISAGSVAQVNFTGGTYNQDFDTLVNSGTANAWTDNATLVGWYMRRVDDVNGVLVNQYNAGDGGSNAGAVYSFGTVSATERALGSVASGSVEHAVYGLRLTNGSGQLIDSFTLDYIGEQWRNGGNTTPHSLMFSYNIGGSGIGADTQPSGGEANYGADPSFVRVASLDFTGPVALATASALDGNLVENQAAISGTVSGISWGAGQDLWIRWVDVNNVGNDHGLGVDNVQFTANPVPEPGTMAALTVGALGFFARRRRSRA